MLNLYSLLYIICTKYISHLFLFFFDFGIEFHQSTYIFILFKILDAHKKLRSNLHFVCGYSTISTKLVLSKITVFSLVDYNYRELSIFILHRINCLCRCFVFFFFSLLHGVTNMFVGILKYFLLRLMLDLKRSHLKSNLFFYFFSFSLLSIYKFKLHLIKYHKTVPTFFTPLSFWFLHENIFYTSIEKRFVANPTQCSINVEEN